MSWEFDILVEVAKGALSDSLFSSRFTSRQFAEALHESQQYLSPYERYRRPLLRGATAGQVLRRLREEGLVDRVGPEPKRYWQRRRPPAPCGGERSPRRFSDAPGTGGVARPARWIST